MLLVLLALPIVTTLFFHPPAGSGSVTGVAVRWLPDLAFVALAVSLGRWRRRSPDG